MLIKKRGHAAAPCARLEEPLDFDDMEEWGVSEGLSGRAQNGTAGR